MGKKKIAEMEKLEVLFYEGGQKNGHDKAVLNKIWEDWKKFASYAFNKSHATCYSWVAYQTAYLKAHYPAEYMAAVMSRNLENITEVTKLMDECRAMGIRTLGPDVNESRLEFSVNSHGEIRFGVAAIKGMGVSAANAIIDEREKNGPYKSIYDVYQRVSFSNCNRKCFESMALSGGFDSFGLKREQYFATNSKGDVFLDSLFRYGSAYQSEQQMNQNSLFGGMDAVELATPPAPAAEQWSTIERLNKERELVGIYISAHPLDEFSVVLNGLCNTHCDELDDKAELSKKEEILVGGIVTGVKERYGKNGKKFGIVTIEDFESSGELAVFGEEWGRWQGMLKEGCTIFIKAKCTPGKFNSNYYNFQISDIQYLQTVKEQRIEKITITIDSDSLDDTLVTDLATLIEDSPGNTQLYIQILDTETKRPITLRSRNRSINIQRDLINFIHSNEGMSYKIN